MTTPTALTASQCRAARALIEWSQAQLSQSAAIDIQTIRDGKIVQTHHLENWLSALGQLRTKQP